MIFDTLDHIDLYKDIHPTLYRGLQLLRDTDFTKYEVGRYEVDGDNLFFMVQEYNAKAVNEKPESHKNYADIQFVYEGAELMGYAPLCAAVSEKTALQKNDNYFYETRIDTIALYGNRFFVAFPQDIHAPAISPDGTCSKVKKVVVKVKL